MDREVRLCVGRRGAVPGLIDRRPLSFNQDPSLSGITVIAADRAYVTSLAQTLRQAAQHSLHGALRSMNQVSLCVLYYKICQGEAHTLTQPIHQQAELGPALQFFYNLRELPAVVLESLQLLVAEAREATIRALDPQALERGDVDARDGWKAGRSMAC